MKKNLVPSNISFYLKSQNTVKKIILENLPKDIDIYLFGSGVTNEHSYNSDIDVALDPHFDFDENIIRKIKDLIEDSYVPFKVDIIDLRKVSDRFKKEVFKKVKKWR